MHVRSCDVSLNRKSIVLESIPWFNCTRINEYLSSRTLPGPWVRKFQNEGSTESVIAELKIWITKSIKKFKKNLERLYVAELKI